MASPLIWEPNHARVSDFLDTLTYHHALCGGALHGGSAWTFKREEPQRAWLEQDWQRKIIAPMVIGVVDDFAEDLPFYVRPGQALFCGGICAAATLPDSDGQVFVFHFPGVIQRVIRGVPNQIPERPSSGHFTLSMERPNGVAIGVAVRLQTLVDQHRTFLSGHPDLLCPLLLHAKRMTDDVIPITPSPSWTLLHLGRHAPTDVLEKRPARLHQCQVPFQCCALKVVPIDSRERQRDA